jgi:hypothetical protein
MKKVGLMSLVITMTVLLTLALSSAAPVPPPHPRVHEAIEAMRHAREHMEHADGEFHGHRARTIEHLDAAIHEAEACMQEP